MEQRRLGFLCGVARRNTEPAAIFKAYGVRSDGTHIPIEAEAIIIEMDGGRDLLIRLHERFPGEGVGVIYASEHDSDGNIIVGGRLILKLGAANACFVSVEPHPARRAEDR